HGLLRAGAPTTRARSCTWLRRAAAAEELLEDAADAPLAAEVEIEIFDGRSARPALPGVRPWSIPAAALALVCATKRFGRIPACVAELVVLLALVGVGEHVVCFLHFLELLRRLRVVLVDVGMMLANELPVRLADLIRRRGTRDAKNFVVVALRHT